MNDFREEEKAKLTSMTVLSNAVIKNLDSKVEKAEKILKLAEMNRKLETEREKVLPFYEETSVQEIEIQNEVTLASFSAQQKSHGLCFFSFCYKALTSLKSSPQWINSTSALIK